MNSTNLTFVDIRMLLGLLKYRSVCPSQQVDARLKELLCPVIIQKVEIPRDDHGPSNSNYNIRH